MTAPFVQRASTARTVALGLAATAVLAAAALLMPRWLLFLATMAASHGVVTLGIVLLMRGGVVSFGQGLVFAAGGYGAALVSGNTGVTDVVALTLVGGLAAALVAAPFAPLLSRYRAIFFAMLTLALSMVMYGILVKTEALGGSDGFNVARPTLFGATIAAEEANFVLYLVTVVIVGLLSILARIYFDSTRGMVALAIKENELRVEYLGGSVRRVIAGDFVIAAFLGGVGGALTVLSLGHIEPNFSYWTTSGEFVFAAILAGHHSVAAVFVAAFALEMVRSFSNLYFPNTWQLALGLFLLVVIRFLPNGVGSLWAGRRRAAPIPAAAAGVPGGAGARRPAGPAADGEAGR
jgi:ABC-type branched-subunit amino acid transport system permease subunit